MNSLELAGTGLQPLSESERYNSGGGEIPFVVWSILSSLVSNFGDFKQGVSDGFNLKPPRY
jgi:hypothetical protein